MNPSQHVRVAILGAGTAGLSAQREVARHTDSYRVIDPGPLGTACARKACMPSKALIQVANDYHRVRRGAAGLDASRVAVDRAAVMQHVRRLRDHFVEGVLAGMRDWRDTHFIRGRAAFIDPRTLDIDGARLTAERIIIATGSKPALPEPWVKFRDHLLDSDGFFELEELPANLAVIGLGAVGIELAQAVQRLGADVTGIDPGRDVGGLTDPDLQDAAIEAFSRAMTLHFTRAEIRGADGEGVRIALDGHTVRADPVLVATGRPPAVQGLALDRLDVPLDERGLPEFDRQTLQVGGLPVFVAGDANGMRPLLHEAADEGRIAAWNALRDQPACFERRTPLAITFTDPNIARVGARFTELEADGVEFVTGAAHFRNQGRALMTGATDGLLHVYAAPADGRLLGAELFAPAGEHLAHLLAWAISRGLTVVELMRMPFYHPVHEEALRTALRNAARRADCGIDPAESMRCADNPVL